MSEMKRATYQRYTLTLENAPYRLTVQSQLIRSRVRDEEFGWSEESAERAEAEFNLAKLAPDVWVKGEDVEAYMREQK